MNIIAISGYIKRLKEPRLVSGDNKIIEFSISVRKVSARQTQKYNYFDCTCWRGKADYVEKYAKEGEFVIITGELEQTSYDNKDGKKVYKTFINVADIQIPRLSDTTADEIEKKSMEEEGYVDVGKTSAKTVNNIYKSEENNLDFSQVTDDDLPF